MSLPGILSIVATPIGNLEDLTFRALRTLGEVDVIAAEDTRRTSQLLAHYRIAKPLVSLHEHNEHAVAPVLVRRVLAGEHVALVSDAGTPCISDPGSELVRLARSAGITVVPIPGPSAITSALSVSGFDLSGGFAFVGFPPPSGAGRGDWFKHLAEDRRALVAFEAPHRISRTVRELGVYLSHRQILAIREITKIHETLVLSPNHATISDKGEFVIVIGPHGTVDTPISRPRSAESSIDVLYHLTNTSKFSDEAVVEAVDAASNLSPVRLRNMLKKARLVHRRQSDSQ